jgi:hypothetical protein
VTQELHGIAVFLEVGEILALVAARLMNHDFPDPWIGIIFAYLSMF